MKDRDSRFLFMRPIEILLVEDNPGDVRLTQEALGEAKVRNNLAVARDGVEAIAYLRREAPFEQATRPDLVRSRRTRNSGVSPSWC